MVGVSLLLGYSSGVVDADQGLGRTSSGSSDKTIQQWVDEEWEARQRQRQQDMLNLLLFYSRSIPELNEKKEIATYF